MVDLILGVVIVVDLVALGGARGGRLGEGVNGWGRILARAVVGVVIVIVCSSGWLFGSHLGIAGVKS